MFELLTLEKCASYAAACATFAIVHRAAFDWPDPIAENARVSAIKVVTATAHGVGHLHRTEGRVICLHEARRAAIDLQACIDIAFLMNDRPPEQSIELGHARRLAVELVDTLNMFVYAETLLSAKG